MSKQLPVNIKNINDHLKSISEALDKLSESIERISLTFDAIMQEVLKERQAEIKKQILSEQESTSHSDEDEGVFYP
jgi:hypothetical protein